MEFIFLDHVDSYENKCFQNSFIHSWFVNLVIETLKIKNCKLITVAHCLLSILSIQISQTAEKVPSFQRFECFSIKYNVFLQFCHGVRFFIFWSIFNFPCHSSTATAVFCFSQGGAKFLCCRRRQKALRFETWRLSFRRPK